ncbi:MAG: AMP-binding protein [Gammaproteobacteria bacterium]|nr:AMP-binding protein [Gammaproteobacteria bacterium]
MEKIWLKRYPANVPAEINLDTYTSVVQIFEESFAKYNSAPAFYSMGVTLTFKQVDECSRAFAAYLQDELKLTKGQRVAIMLPNVLQYPVVMFGILRAGLIAVNVNPLYTAPELVHQLNDAGAETLIVLSNFASTVEKALPDVTLKNVIVTNIGDLFPWPKSSIVNFVVKHIKKKVPAWHIPSAIPFTAAMAAGKKLTFHPVALGHQDIAFLQYTGGTTGVAKGAILTHGNLVANILQAEAWFKPLFVPGKETIVTALPLYHIFSLTANCLFLMKIGGFNILIINARDLDSLVSDMSKFKFTVITGVNTLFNGLLKNSHFLKLDFSSLKLALGGGMAVQRAVAERWHEVTGVPLLEAYGLTETSPCASINPVTLTTYNGTVGLPVSSTDVCIFDEDGNEVPLGESGELAIKGPQVMRGYWQNPQETAKVFTKDGWLLTGDIASMDENGFLRILERKKDMILVSGFNVYPNEIEDVLVSMPGIREAAVISVPDENSGEVPKAFIVRENQDITVADVIAFCRTKLTGYKIPRHVKFCEDLPKTNVGKVMRRALRQQELNQ